MLWMFEGQWRIQPGFDRIPTNLPFQDTSLPGPCGAFKCTKEQQHCQQPSSSPVDSFMCTRCLYIMWCVLFEIPDVTASLKILLTE